VMQVARVPSACCAAIRGDDTFVPCRAGLETAAVSLDDQGPRGLGCSRLATADSIRAEQAVSELAAGFAALRDVGDAVAVFGHRQRHPPSRSMRWPVALPRSSARPATPS
jgi:hypothetical protein